MPRRESPLESEMLQGRLDMLALGTLVLGPAHGHTIAHAIERGVGGCPADRTRLPLPRLASIGGSWVDRILLGHFGKQSQSEVLPSDTSRAETVDRPDYTLGTSGANHRPHSETCHGVTNELTSFLPAARNGIASDPQRSSRTCASRPMKTSPEACRMTKRARQR
jgi:hypothetical protein